MQLYLKKTKPNNVEKKRLPEKPVVDEEAIQKLKEEFYIRMAAERKARIEHRRRRKPRTRGVLFKRLPDGSIVNADLSEEERVKRAEKRMSRRETRANGDSFRNKKTHRSSGVKNNLQSSEVNETSKEEKIENNDNEKNEKKKFVPSPGPTQSAWIAGPPPSMKTSKPAVENEVTPNPQTESKNFTDDTTPKTVDQVLSSGLLDIGHNGDTPSWSADSTQPKVAVGPIMSSWSAFSGNGGTVGFDSFGSKSAENTNVSGVDWNMDFALPHDLLSNAVDSEEEVTTPVEKNKNNKDNNNNEEPSSAPPTNKRFKKPMRPKKDFNKKFSKSGNPHYSSNYKGKNPRPYGGRGFKRNPRFDNKQKKVDNQKAEALN